MQVLTAGIATTLEFYRDNESQAVTNCIIVDPSDGSTVDTLVVTDDSTADAVAAITRNSSEFTAANADAGVKYILRSDAGPYQRVEVVSKDAANLCMTSHPITFAVTNGDLFGIRSTASFTPAAAYIASPLWAIWQITGGEAIRELLLVVKYRAQCPITSDDVLTQFPRLERGALPPWQRSTGVGWQPQVDEAWNLIRSELYNMPEPVILDQIINTDALKGYVMAHVAKMIIKMGTAPSGESDITESLSRYNKMLEMERSKARQLKLSIDYDDDNTDTATGYGRGIRFNLARDLGPL